MEIKSVAVEDLTHHQENLLKKRRRDDVDQRKRIDARAKAKFDSGRKKKMAEKEASGANILMPEVFVSNQMKQQRNYVKYKRSKGKIALAEKASKSKNGFKQGEAPEQRVKDDALLIVIRIKGSNNTSPQAQKILNEIGLTKINNCVFLKANEESTKKVLLVSQYISYGYPTKKIVSDLIRKRGFLKKDGKKLPITDNVLIEEMLGEHESGQSCICIEDIIDTVYKCYKSDNDEIFHEIRKVMWPF